MELTNDQRKAADRLLATQARRPLRLPEAQRAQVDEVLAARKVEIFNACYPVGAPVMYIPGVWAKPQRERVYRAARVERGQAVAELAGVQRPIDVDQCFGVPEEVPAPHRARQRHPGWLIAAAAAAGVLLAAALLAPSAGAVSPARIVIDCYEPGEAPGAESGVERRRT